MIESDAPATGIYQLQGLFFYGLIRSRAYYFCVSDIPKVLRLIERISEVEKRDAVPVNRAFETDLLQLRRFQLFHSAVGKGGSRFVLVP